MKKIFTLLFCVASLTAAASSNSLADRCINLLLGNNAAPAITAPGNDTNLDANNDGIIDIDDVTVIIDNELMARNANVNRAPAQDIDVDRMINRMLENEPPVPQIKDVDKAVENNLRNK
jgi:hypothetical protein